MTLLCLSLLSHKVNVKRVLLKYTNTFSDSHVIALKLLVLINRKLPICFYWFLHNA